MASRDDYMAVARQIASHMNAFRLAFKSYNVTQLNEMIQAVAGSGSKVTGDERSEQLRTALLERGFTIYPEISAAEDGYFRVIRANSVVGNLLNAFKYVGANGDEELAKLLNDLKRRRRPDDLDADTPE